MAASNKDIAISYLDQDVGQAFAIVTKRLKAALHAADPSEIQLNTVALAVDPTAQTITAHQNWFACQPEVFDVTDFMAVIAGSRRRR
jgi:hypothetical protein